MAGDLSTADGCLYYWRPEKDFEERIPFVCLIALLCTAKNGPLTRSCQRMRLPMGSARAAVQPSLFLSPEQLQSQLNLPGACGSRSDNACCRRWSARRRGKYNCVWGIEVRVVEHVKEIRSELRAEALRQRESFRDRQIQLGQSRSLQCVASHVAVSSVERRNERVRIEGSVRPTEN